MNDFFRKVIFLLMMIFSISCLVACGSNSFSQKNQEENSSISEISSEPSIEENEVADNEEKIELSDSETVIEADNRITIDNEYAILNGGVSYEMDLDEYVENYNEIVDIYVDTSYKDDGYAFRENAKNSFYIFSDQFYEKEFEDGTKEYTFVYKNDPAALFRVYCEPVTSKVTGVQYLVSPYLYDSGDGATNELWRRVIPFYIFAGIDGGGLESYWKNTQIDELEVYYKNGVGTSLEVIEIGGIPFWSITECAYTEELFNEIVSERSKDE